MENIANLFLKYPYKRIFFVLIVFCFTLFANISCKELTSNSIKTEVKFKTTALVTPSENDVLKVISSPEHYGLNKDTVIFSNNHQYRKAISLIKKDKRTDIKGINISVKEQTNKNLVLDVAVPESGYLIIEKNYDKNWIATDNNIDTPIIKANYSNQAIRISSGTHKIEFSFKPFANQIIKGILFSIFIIILGLFVINKLLVYFKKENIFQTNFLYTFILAILIIGILMIPYIISYLRTPENYTFIGFDSSPNVAGSVSDADLFSYIAKMRQGYEGNILYQNRYTIEESSPTALFIFYTILGNLSRFFSVNLVLFYFIANYICDLILILGLGLFNSHFFKSKKWVLITIFMICFSTGYSFLYILFPGLSINQFGNDISADVIIPEFSTFTSIMDVCHFPFCISLMLFIFFIIIKNSENNLYYFLLSVLTFCLGLVHPFDFVTVFSVSFVFLCIQLFIYKDVLYKKNILKFIFLFVIGFLPVLYINYILNTNIILKLTFKDMNILTSLPITSYFMGYGTNFLLAALGILYIFRKKIILNKEIVFLLVWIITNFILLYSPFDFQRRFVMGLQIPIVILSMITLNTIFEKEQIIRKFIISFIVVITCFTSTFLILNERASKIFFFIDSDILSLYKWINNNNISNKNFFSYDYMGTFTPAFSSNRVFLGHWCETVNFKGRRELVNKFFNIDSQKQIKFLKDINIDYLIYGPDEKKLGKLDFSELNNSLKIIYSIGNYDLVEVKK